MVNEKWKLEIIARHRKKDGKDSMNGMQKRILLFYMNTSDYPDILKSIKSWGCDVFICHYMAYPLPHELVREFLINHPEYTHILIHAHDVLFTKQDYENLIKRADDFDILAAVCNVEREGHRDYFKMCITNNLPSMDKTKRMYNWIPFGAIEKGIIKVLHQGNALTLIKRDTALRRDIEGEYVFKGANNRDTNNFTAAPDLTMSHICNKLNISIHADTRIIGKHYANHKATMIGKTLSKTEFIKGNG